MNRYIAPLVFAFAGVTAGFTADADAAKPREIKVERYGWMLKDGGCHVRVMAGREKLSLDDLRRLHEDGQTRDGRLSLQSLFPGTPAEEAQVKVETAARQLVDTIRAVKNDPVCRT